MQKLLLLLICLFGYLGLQAQEYPFVPKGLKLLPVEEVFKKPPPAKLDLVFNEDGTKATLQEAINLFMSGSHIPQMYVDDQGVYKALVIKAVKNESIDYKNIPEDLASYGYSVGNPNSEKVIIYTQGGPSFQLNRLELVNLFGDFMDKNNIFFVHIHQVQTLNPSWFENDEISFEKAKEYGKVTTKMLAELIQYFKSENKKIYIVGTSFGAFAGADLIAEYGNIANGYLLGAGRLDMTEEVWKAWSDGIKVKRNDDAVGVTIGKKADDVSVVNSRKIGAALGHKRYTQLLESFDLSNLIYVHGIKDLSVGKLTDNEISFLKSKNANVIAKNVGHGDTCQSIKEYIDLLLSFE